jgi:hypothetical protein
VFAQRLNVSVAGEPAPKAWLDQFFMRYFTGSSAFDETLPVDDGVLEAGYAVRPEEVEAQFGAWLRGRKMIAAGAEVAVRGSAAGSPSS